MRRLEAPQFSGLCRTGYLPFAFAFGAAFAGAADFDSAFAAGFEAAGFLLAAAMVLCP